MTLVLMVLTSTTAWADSTFSGGTGTETDPYLISSFADWETLCNDVNNNTTTYKGKYFKLMADITGLEQSLNVGTGSYAFEGNFDGNYHTLDISNFWGWGWAPFHKVRDATIKRLHVTGKIKCGDCRTTYHGGIIGVAYGNVTLVSCQSSVEFKLSGSYNASMRHSQSGGLVGWVNGDDAPASLTMVNCLFDGKISVDNAEMVGGFIGRAKKGTSVTLVNCLFDPQSVKEHESKLNSTFLALNDYTNSKHACPLYFKMNCFRKKKFGKAEGEDASGLTNSQLLDRLGSGWQEVDGKVVPGGTIDFYQFAAGEGTETNPYLISSTEEWKGLAHNISIAANYSGKFFKLTNDITLREAFSNSNPVTMLGLGQGISFRGTFDGDGHTITLDYTDYNNGDYCGPFRFINDATIKNLHVTGTIVKDKGKHAGGFVGQAFGTNLISNCVSSVDIQSSTDGDGSHGGFLGDLRDGATTFKNCVFNGKLQGTNTKMWGGFVGWVADGQKAYFNNCLFAPTLVNVKNDGNRTFARRDDGDDVILNNSYYTKTLGSAQGKEACTISADEHVTITPDGTEEPGISGGITAYSLGSEAGSTIYNGCIKYGDAVYSGSGTWVNLSLAQNGDTPAGCQENSFIATPGSLLLMMDNYILYMPNDNTTITLAPTDWNTHAGTEADPYLIYTAEQWKLLADRVNNDSQTYSGKFFKLMNDITVTESVSSGTPATMVGTSDSKSFQGTFDGNGHTITLNYNDTRSADFCAPFRYIKDATIKYLHVNGAIFKTQGKNAGGLVGKAVGNNTIDNCRSSVDIHFDKDGDVSSGGFIGELRESGGTTFNNCLFDGELRGENSYSWGGFVGWVASGRTVTLNNCLFAPEGINYDNTDGDDDSKTFARRDGTVTVNNCYYKTIVNDAQGSTSAVGYTNERLLNALGLAWETIVEEKEEKVVPIMAVYPFSGDGTESSPYLITSTEDWNHLASNQFLKVNYNGKYFQLTNDISVTRMVGYDGDNAFQGTFDGGGNTITVSYGTADSPIDIQYAAAFKNTYGATIKNLVTEGTIYTSSTHAGGVVGRNGTNSLTMTNVKSNVTINSTHSGQAHHGGLVGYTLNATLTGCAFTGKLLGSNSTHCGGLMGWKTSTEGTSADFNDCLFAPTEITVSTTGSKTLVVDNGTVNFNNCYYTETLGTAQGKQAFTITADDNITMEGAGTITEYDVSGITGLLSGIVYDEVFYASSDDEVRLNLYASEEETYDGYTVGFQADKGTLSESDNHYILTMPNDNVTISLVLNPKEWDGDGSETDPYLIYNAAQLDMLATRVNAGNAYSGKYFKLMDNIDYAYSDLGETESNFTAIGDASHSFQGHFDGDNYAVSGIRIYKGGNTSADSYLGLFGHIEGASAEVRNVVLDYAVITGYNYVGGIVGCNGNGQSDGGNVTNSHVTNSTIIAVQTGASWLGGIAGYNKGSISRTTSSATITTADGSDHYGAICGDNVGTLENNYYTACNVAGVENASDVGCNKEDVTSDDGAVPALRDDADNSVAIDLLATASDILHLNVSLTGRTLYKDGSWNTLCLPFDISDFSGTPLEGATVKTLESATYDETDGTLTLNFSDDLTAIEAGKPYIVKWATPTTDVTNPVFNRVAITNTLPADLEGTAADFIGICSPYTTSDKSVLYLGASNKLNSPEEGFGINAFRGYLQLKEGLVASLEGDVNDDGKTSVSDVMMMVDYILGIPSEGFNEGKADINGDGSIGVADVMALVDIILLGENDNISVVTNIDSDDTGITYGGEGEGPARARENHFNEE